MRLRLLSVLVAVAACGLALASGSRATQTRYAEPVSQSAAAACAGHTSVSTKLTGSDIGFLRSFATCDLKKLTGKTPAVSAQLNRLAAADLKKLVSVSSVKGLDPALSLMSEQVGTSYCHKTVPGDVLSIDNTPPPTFTPLLLSQTLAETANLNLEKAKGTAFGFAYAHTVFAHDGHTANPVAMVFIAINCNTKPVKLDHPG